MTAESYPQYYSLVNERYSCRKYSADKVSRDLLLAILDTARLAPSACNKQPWHFVVADTDELCAEISECYGRDWVKTVPAFIIVCGKHADAWHRADGKDHTDIDIAIATEHICLAATSLKLGTCWICNFDTTKLAETLNLPTDMEAIAIIAVGYPAPATAISAKKRKNIDEITQWGKF